MVRRSISPRVSVLSLRNTSMHRGGLICARLRAETDGEAIPAIDCDDRECQVHQFLFAEILAHLLVEFIRDVVIRNQCHTLCPREGRTLAFRVVRGFAPRIEAVETLLALASNSRIFPVHIETKSAPIELRSTQPDQFEQ